MKSNIHIITERREGTITEGTIQMGGSATKYINYGKTIVFFNKGQITYQINCEVPFPDFKSQLLTPEDVIASYPLKNLVVIKYHNANIESVTGYYHGKKEGKCLEYNNCKLSREMTYVQNKLEGVYIAHSAERIECEYKNGLKHGKETIKYENNNIKHVGHYINGKRDGDFIWFYSNGTFRILCTYKNDKLDGLETKFHENRNKATETYYRNGLKHGESKEYNPAGVLVKKCNYRDDKLDGECLEYDQAGVLVNKWMYKNNVLNGTCINYENDKITLQREYKDGVMYGPYESYYRNGNLKEIGTYRNSKFWPPGDRYVGERKTFHENGNVKEELRYDNECQQDGPQKYYDELGNLLATDMYVHGTNTRKICHTKSALDMLIYDQQRMHSTIPTGPTALMNMHRQPHIEYEPAEQKIDLPPPKYTEPNNILTFMRQISKEPPPPQYVEPSAPPMPLQFPAIPNNQELEEGVVKPILMMD